MLIATAGLALLLLAVAAIKCTKQYSNFTYEVDQYLENRVRGLWEFIQFLVFLTVMEHMISIVAAIRWSGLQLPGSKGTFALSVLIVLGNFAATVWKPMMVFHNRKLNILVLLKKILFPILLCLNISPLVLPLVMLVLLIS